MPRMLLNWFHLLRLATKKIHQDLQQKVVLPVGVGDEEVVADNLDCSVGGQLGIAFPVVLRFGILRNAMWNYFQIVA